MNHIITARKAICSLFGSSIHHKPNYVFKSNYYEFYNRNIGLFSCNYTRVAGYFIEKHRYIRTRKELFNTVSYAELNTISLNSRISKVVPYILDNKYLERIYVLLKLIFSYLWVLCLEDSIKVVMDKVFYYHRMTKISIIK